VRRGSAPRWARSGTALIYALAERFFATLECALLTRSSLRTHADARAALFDFIEVFYNRRRRHSALGYLSPERFERRRFTQTPVLA
jgi:putative transposase